jgi:hypothetical protein
MRRAFAAVVIAFLQCCGSAAMALGFGPVSNNTRLGQSLDFTVALRLDADEQVAPSCVTADVTAGDNRIPPAQIRTRLVRQPRATDAQVRITSTARVREPVVTVVVSVGCPPRAAHKFVSLLDPPAAARAEAAKVTKVAAAPVVATAQPPAAAPLVAQAVVTEPPVAPAADAAERQRDREQMQAMQDRVDGMRQDVQALQQTIGVLQARLRATEEMRHDPALYGLATLVLLLLGVIGMLLWRQWRQRSEAAWVEEARSLGAALGPRPSEARRMAPQPPSGFEASTMSSMHVAPSEPLARDSEPPPAPADGVLSTTTLPAAARVRRELTPEELIDLEQQADFFIAIGQEESAIDLLMAHVRSSGGTSPMPYLKLLAIYRRRDEAEPYERIRERFNRRFNGHAPEWQSDPARGRPLDDYPEVLERLQRAWVTPVRATDLLEALLFRRDPAAAGFDLPAYEELLFLHGVVRDIVDHTPNAEGVDLLLPLEHGDDTPAITRVAPAAPPHAPSRHEAVDVQIDLDAPRAST